MDVCGNCGSSFELSAKMDTIISTWNLNFHNPAEDRKLDPDWNECGPAEIKIVEALSVIFEQSPLSSNSSKSGPKLSTTTFEKTAPLAFCTECAETLTILYNSYKEFVQLCNLECEVAKRLQEIQELCPGPKPEEVELEDKEKNQSYSKVSKVSKTKPGRGRKRKNISKRPVAKVKRNSKDDLEEELMPFGVNDVKVELEVSDWDDGGGNDFDGLEDEVLAPEETPNICDNGNEDFVDTKRSRPIRKAAARITNFASYFDKDDDDFGADSPTEEDRSLQSATDPDFHEVRENSKKETDPDFQPEPKDPLSLSDAESESDGGRDEDAEWNPGSSTSDDTGKLKCEKCESCFAHKNGLRRHERMVHSGTPRVRLPCSKCSKTFSRSDDLKKHLRNIHGEYIPSGRIRKENTSGLKCEVCANTFFDLSTLRKHRNFIHHVRTDKPLPIADADQIPGTNPEDGEPDSGVRFQCHICQKEYKIEKSLQAHMITHGHGSAEKYKCEICGTEFIHESSKRRHMDSHSKPHSCPVEGCTKTFARKYYVYDHMRAVHKGVEIPKTRKGPCQRDNMPEKVRKIRVKKAKRTRQKRRIQCTHCDKLIRSDRINEHILTHTGVRNHLCDVCGQSFCLRSTLKNHRHEVHSIEPRLFPCTECDLVFKRLSILRAHKLGIHADSGPFICEHCGKAFRYNKTLRMHMDVHENVEKVTCQQCGKSFSRVDNMRLHYKAVHEGIKIRKISTGPAKPRIRLKAQV